MKNALLIWNVVLTLLTGYLLVQQFGDSAKAGKSNVATTDAAEVKPVRIAYFEMDSIENNFEKVKEVKKEIADKDEHYNNELYKLDMQMQRKIQEFREKGNTMTEQEMANAQTTLQRLEQKLKGEKQLLDGQYQDFVVRRNLDVRKQIADYIAKFNQDGKYTYVIANEPGLFFFKDTVYNITDVLVKGLNEEFRASKKEEK